MSDYAEIEYVLSAIFSVETGLSEDAARALFMRSLENPNWRSRFEQELEKAFSSHRTPWKILLCNNRYEVFEPMSDAEARSFLARMLWEPTFPNKAVPVPS